MVESREPIGGVGTGVSSAWKPYNAGKPRDPPRPLLPRNMGPDYLVPFHLVTTGKFGDELGSDESPILLVNYAIHDVTNNKVSTVFVFFSERALTEEDLEKKLNIIKRQMRTD